MQPGDVVQIHSGVFREPVTLTQSGTKEQPIRFEAASGATVIITGADPLTGWSLEKDGGYSIPWPHRLFQGDDHNPGGAEQVFVAGVLLRKVASLEQLAEGTFHVDLPRQRLHLRAGRHPDETPAGLNKQIARRGFPGFHQTRSTSSLSHAVNAGRQIIAHSPEDSAACFPAPDL